MKAPPETSRRLRLELLETRTLLAADLADPFGLTADFNLALHALNATGDYQASFDTRYGNHQLVITGSANSSLTIDMAQLPDFVSYLKIENFSSVNLTGTDHVDTLWVKGIGSVAADGLSITKDVIAINVSSLDLASVENNVAISGSEMKLTVGSFGDVGTILSDVGTLTFTSQTKHVEIVAMGKDAPQTLNLTYVPAKGEVNIRGYETSSVHVVLPPIDGGSNPQDPTDNGGNPTPGDGSGNPDPGPFAIITLPLDERTRAFLDQLRLLLHSSQVGADQQLVELLNHGDPSARAIKAIDPAQFIAAGPHPLSTTAPLDDLLGDSGRPLPLLAETSKFSRTLPGQMIWSEQDPVLVRAGEVVTKGLPDGLSLPNLVSVDVSWPISFAAVDIARPETVRSENGEPAESSVADGVRAIGTYIVERFTAEFSPGQQSLVLLIDPQPTRSAAGSRKPEIERNSTLGTLPAQILYV